MRFEPNTPPNRKRKRDPELESDSDDVDSSSEEEDASQDTSRSVAKSAQQLYEEVDDPKLVKGPVADVVSPALKKAWAVNKAHRMALIFDAVNPVRQFKRNAKYDDDLEDPYAEYDPDPDGDPNVTKTDEDGDTQPYSPVYYQ